MIRERNLDPSLRGMLNSGASMLGMAEKIYLVGNGSASHDYFMYNKPSDNVHTTLPGAFAAAVSGRNDVIVVSPDNHSLAATFTHNKNMTHIMGSYVGSRHAIRNRIGMSTTFSPMITVSGYGNTFANIYTMHGTASTDYIGWNISGHRNTFFRVNFGGPMNSAQGGHASYEGITVGGVQCSFEECVIGTTSIGRDEASPNVTLEAGSNTDFVNCDFQCYLTDGDPIFVSVENTNTLEARFKGCNFYALNANWATAMTKAFNFTSGSTAAIYIDANCCLYNVTDWTGADDDQWGIWLPFVLSTTDDDVAFRASRPSLA